MKNKHMNRCSTLSQGPNLGVKERQSLPAVLKEGAMKNIIIINIVTIIVSH